MTNEPDQDKEAQEERPDPGIPDMPTIQTATESYRPPQLEITDEDRENFADALASGELYRERFVRGKLDITFRVKTRRETEYLAAQISDDFSTGEIGGPYEHLQAVNTYNLRIQTCKVGENPIEPIMLPQRPWFRGPGSPKREPFLPDGPPQTPRGDQEVLFGSAPAGTESAPTLPSDLSIRSQIESSFMGDYSDAMMFVTLGLLAQFDDKTQRLQREMLDPKYSAPGSPS